MTLLLLHGFSGSPEVWDAVVSHLPGSSLVLRPALGGHGAPRTSWDEEVDRLLALVAEHRNVHVVGYSMGGRLAFGMLARRHPAIRRATFVGAHPGLRTADAREGRRRDDAVWIDRLNEGLPGFVDAWSALPMWDSQRRVPADARAARRRIRLGHEADGLAHALRAYGLAEMPPLDPTRIDVPVTLVVGEDDLKYRAIAQDLAPRFRDARLAVVPGSGHDVTLEAPRALAALIDTPPRAQAAARNAPAKEKTA